jgi:hypothetical protein
MPTGSTAWRLVDRPHEGHCSRQPPYCNGTSIGSVITATIAMPRPSMAERDHQSMELPAHTHLTMIGRMGSKWTTIIACLFELAQLLATSAQLALYG